MILPFLPILPRRSRKCERCGLYFARRENQCPHCTGLSEGELERLRHRAAQMRSRGRELGKLFLFIAALLALGVLALAL